MRKFSIREKEFLILLENISKDEMQFFSFFMQNKYFTRDKKTALGIFPPKAEALLFIQKNTFDNLKLRKVVYREFMEIIFLIEHLKQNRLIDILPNQEAQKQGLQIMREEFSINQTKQNSNIILNNEDLHFKFPELGKIFNKGNDVAYEAMSLGKDTYDLIMNNLMGLLFVSNELIEFVQNGFRSEEDIRYKRNQFATWISIFIAFVFGLWGILNTSWFNDEDSLKLDNRQFDSILSNNEEINDNITRIFEILKEEDHVAKKTDTTNSEDNK